MAAQRSDSPFTSGGETCAAWLYEPEGEGPHPCVVMAHGFAGVREQRLDAYAERFAAAGLAVLLFDYRYFGASTGEPRQLLSIGKQKEDWHAAVAHARALPGVDPRRVAVWGSSLSGGHVVAVAAADPQLAAVVSQAPFTDGLSAIRAGGPAAAVRLTLAGIKDGLGMVTGRDPVYLPAAGDPGTTAAMSSSEAIPGMERISPAGSTWENRVAGRIALTIGGYRPYAKFSKLRMPVWVCVCEKDQTTPPAPAVRAAERSANAELERYDIGHFEIYVPPAFEEVVSAQTDFLVRNLIGDAAATPGATAAA